MNFKELVRKRWFFPALMAVLLLVWMLTSQSKEDSEVVQAWAPLARGDFVLDAVETGEVRALHSVDIKAPMEWRMDLQIIDMVEEGQLVKAGDFLVQFDVAELQQRLELARDRLASALAQRDKVLAEQSARLAQLHSDVTAAEYSEDIAELQKELLKFEAESRRQDADLEKRKAVIQLEEAQTNLESQQVIDASALSSLKVEIARARNEVMELENKIDGLTLRAPISGMLIYNEVGWWDNRKKAARGDRIRPGEPMVSIPNLDSMQVRLRVNEMDASRIMREQGATITLDAYPNQTFTGRVHEIARLAQKADIDSPIKDFEIIVTIDQADSILKPGMTARVQVALGVEKEVLSAPLGAVFERDGKAVVFPRRRYPNAIPVETGSRNDKSIVIQSADLKEGDQLACFAPDSSYHRLGYAEFQQQWRRGRSQLAQAFAAMEARGLHYDYDAHRDRRIIAEGGGGGGDIEALRGEFPGMAPAGKPVELDPASMKRLEQAVRGVTPMPGAPGNVRDREASRQRGSSAEPSMVPIRLVPADSGAHTRTPALPDSAAGQRRGGASTQPRTTP